MAGHINMFVSLQEAMLPKVVDNSYDFGVVNKSVFGTEIRIGSSVFNFICKWFRFCYDFVYFIQISDQSASMWGSCCFKRTDLKVGDRFSSIHASI
jgi:glycerol kinase